MNNKLPLNLNFDLDGVQKGALEAKAAIIQLRDKNNEFSCDGEREDYDPFLLAHRNQVISEIVLSLGQFSDSQNGFLSALFEYIEISFDCHIEPENWRPSAITGEWQ